MYSHTTNGSFYGNSSGFYPSNYSSLLPHSLTSELDNIALETVVPRYGGSNTGSGCTSSSYIGSPNSPLSCCTSGHVQNSTTLLQRSLSSHSFQQNVTYPPVSSPPTAVPDLGIGHVRRVFSTGDLDKGANILRRNQQKHRVGSPLANESASSIIEGMTKACRYSPEEKRERIERYRSKRTQRNFNKKIQYACRKSLADSRPRIKGRFARNDEIDKINYSPDLKWNQMAGEEDDEDEEDWIHLLNSFSSNLVP